MTQEEIKVIELTKEAWNAFVKLPKLHQADEQEFCYHIHALQNMILAREGLRKLREESK